MTLEEISKALSDLSVEERQALVAALLTAKGASPSEDEQQGRAFINGGKGTPELAPAPGMTGSLEDKLPDDLPSEPLDTPDERARLLAILATNPSGLKGETLLDQYKIPPQTIELARREGQVGWAERGLGLTHEYGGPWARDTENIDHEAIERYQKMFKERLELH